MPPFSWMLNLASQNKSEIRNSTTTKQQQNVQLTTPTVFFEYCKNKQCHHGGRLNSDCLCICLPAFTGDQCETGTKNFLLEIFLFFLFCSNLRTRTSTDLYFCT